MTPSPEQQAFFDALVGGSANIQLRAAAGAGKTTTIVEGVKRLPSHLSVVFLAFNKSIVTELEERIGSRCEVATFHKKGYAAWRKHLGRNPKLDGSKLFTLFKEKLGGKDFGKEMELYASFVVRLVGLAKNAGMDTHLMPDEWSNWVALAVHNDLQLQSEDADEQRAIELAQWLLAESNRKADHLIDFDDMLYCPLRLGIKFDMCNVIFIDEAQDTNAVQCDLLKRMKAPSPYGRLIAVGDASQAIYGFRGADASAMDNMKEMFDMVEMPLSVSYRCSKAVVREAQRFCK